MLHDHLRVLHAAIGACPVLGDVILLLKVWLRQRGSGSDFCPGTPNGFHLSSLAAALWQRGVLTAHMTSYQALRVMLQWIGAPPRPTPRFPPSPTPLPPPATPLLIGSGRA